MARKGAAPVPPATSSTFRRLLRVMCSRPIGGPIRQVSPTREFATIERDEPTRRFGFLPGSRTVVVKAMTISTLESALTTFADVGAPDYSDEGMLQYLRTERIVPPYQTKGYKLVELVRIYEVAGDDLDAATKR